MVEDASTPVSEGSTTRVPIDEVEPATGASAAPVVGEGGGLGAAAGPVSAATLASRLLGVVREQVMATLFGAGNAADAFNIAFRIPNLLRDLFAEGALSSAFIPTFTDVSIKEGQARAWQLAAVVLNAVCLVMLCLILLGEVAAPLLVRMIVPGFAAVPEKLALTVHLTRILLPFLGREDRERRTIISTIGPFWDAAQALDPEVETGSVCPGSRAGHLADLFRAAGIGDIVDSAVAVDVEHATFEDWWEPFTLGVAPSGAHVAGLEPDRRTALRELCRERLPEPPFVVSAKAWVARGAA